MPYYMGDFYVGDYYAGDPGFFGGLFRGLGGVIGLGARKVGRALGGKASEALARLGGTPAAAGIASRTGAMARAGARTVGGAIARHPVLTAAGAAGTIGVLGGRVMGPAGAQAVGMAQRGFHISARTGAVVRNRRMRVTNPRALRRAIRRAMGFARLAKRVLRFTSPKAPRGRAVFKFKRRRKV